MSQERAERIVVNLLDNTIKYTPRRWRMHVRYRTLQKIPVSSCGTVVAEIGRIFIAAE